MILNIEARMYSGSFSHMRVMFQANRLVNNNNSLKRMSFFETEPVMNLLTFFCLK